VQPILDETSLLPCPERPAAERIHELARTMRALDGVGAPRVLHSVRDAVDRDLGDGRGLRSWCFDRATQRDAGRFVASRLAAQPFIDGPSGLFAAAEGQRAVEARVHGHVVLGTGLAALTDGIVVILPSETRPAAEHLEVELSYLEDDGMRSERARVQSFAVAAEVERAREALVERLDRTVRDGTTLVRSFGAVFPRLLLGDRARDQISALSGNEPVFRQLIRHLRALDDGVVRWEDGKPFEPVSVTFSVESKATLDDGALGPMRDFPTPPGFDAERWTLHTKLTGGAGARLYFRAVRSAQRTVVLVGYFGDHLPTVMYRT